MSYITVSTDRIAEASDSRRLKLIHKNVRKIKASEKMGVKFMQKWEELAYAREDGRAEGKAEGIVEGETLKLIKLVCKKLIKGEEAETIADELEEEKAGVEQICRIAEKYAPEYDCRKIYQELRMEKKRIRTDYQPDTAMCRLIFNRLGTRNVTELKKKRELKV